MTLSELFERLPASSDLEVLERLPDRYDDMSPLPDRPFLQEGAKVRGCFLISEVKVNAPRRIIRFQGRSAADGFVHSFLVFNQMFYLNRIASGKTLFLLGRYASKFKAVIVKGIYELDNRFAQTGIRPVYRLPTGVGQSAFSYFVDKILHGPSMAYVRDEVPEEFVRKYRLLPRAKAFLYVHQPRSWEELKVGLRNFKYEQALRYCLKMEATRRIRSIYKKDLHARVDKEKVQALVDRLPYRLTEDQIKAVDEILSDMDSPSVMFRMLQGDVGTGKTAVAFLSLYANATRGGQGCLYAPTGSLAMQHHRNALDFFKGTRVRVGLLYHGLPSSQRKRTLSELQSGAIQILIATQAGIGKGVSFHNLSLSIIDEQQQFGVDQRMAMAAKGDAVDTLMMSATPIPRTMSRILYGDLEVSELKAFPQGIVRRVKTKVVKSADPLVEKAVRRALLLRRQTFVVVPRIVGDESEEASERLSAKEVYEEYVRLYGKDDVALLHGRMKKEEQGRILDEFREGKVLILVSTSIVEVGVDVPSACLMVVYSANFFGLSSLHQMRGRIGRDGHRALALLVYDGDDPQAREKLAFLESHQDGYAVSEYDLESRGAGSLGGTDQSGRDELSVIDLSEDRKIFECAMKDASTILDRAEEDQSLKEFRNAVIRDERLEKILA